MQAVIMAGGEGTRLRPLTSSLPKPLVPLINEPMVVHIVKLLKKHHISNVVLTLQFLPNLIRNYLGDGKDFGITPFYSVEEIPLGTAGSVKKAQEFLKGSFVVISGDILTDINLSQAIEFHEKKKALATIVLKRVENPLEFGIVITDKDGRIERFLEKPGWGEVFSDTINTGIYILEPEVLEEIPVDTNFDFSKDLFPKLLSKGAPLFGYIADGYWCDVGGIEQYIKAHHDILEGKVDVEMPGFTMKENIWIDEGVEIDEKANLKGPILIGRYSKIEAGAKILPYTVIGNNIVVKEGAKLERAIIWDNTYIGPYSNLESCVVGRNCDILSSVRVEEGSTIGDNCSLKVGAVINPGVKIFPFKVVEEGALISQHIIWESKGSRVLFGTIGVSGLINLDITPEFANRLAMAFGNLFPKGIYLTTSRDPTRSARMIKRSIISALNATGVNVRDLRTCPPPVNRFDIVSGHSSGGLHVRALPFDPDSIAINFFNEKGIDIDESTCRSIERLFARGEFRRVFYTEIGEIMFPFRTIEFYNRSLIDAINIKEIKEFSPKLVVDYSFGEISRITSPFFSSLGCELIALNTFAGEDRIVTTQAHFEESLKKLGKAVGMFGADLGVIIGSSAERVFLVDDRGRQISHSSMLILLITLISELKGKGKIVVPVVTTDVVDEIAARNHCEVIKTKISQSALMSEAKKRGMIFAGDEGGGYIFPEFLPAYDAMMTLSKLLELLSEAKVPISKLISRLPKYYINQKRMSCSWAQKGLVMRELAERFKGYETDMTDGIKIIKGKRDWVLVLPEPDEPSIKIYAEGKSPREAKQNIDEIAKIINELLGR